VTAQYVETRHVALDELSPYPGNAKRGDVPTILASLRRNGQYRSLVVRAVEHGPLIVLAGNHTKLAFEAHGAGRCEYADARGRDRCALCADPTWDGRTARCEIIRCDDAEARRINLVDNRSAENGDYDHASLAALLRAADADEGLGGTGYTEDDLAALLADENGPGGGLGGIKDENRPSLADRFLVPPFDVLDARQGWWRERKRQWLSLGMRSGSGRDGRLAFQKWAQIDPEYYPKKKAVEQRLGHTITAAEFEAGYYQPPEEEFATGTSIFDPVLSELAYRWFSPPAGIVVDPFAGGSVRGLIAGILGRHYRGNDLSATQVESNREQRDDFASRRLLAADPQWTVGDSADWVDTLPRDSADLLFTCPPYYDLEQYSDNPADLSTMSYDDFDAAYARILAGAARALRPNRFAVIVTGDARDGRGALHDLRGSTIRAAHAAGLTYATGAVLLTPVGSIATTAARGFRLGRALARTHQDVLVFCKGNRPEAAKACGEVDVHLPDEVERNFDVR
jgi:DNA modification methylase